MYRRLFFILLVMGASAYPQEKQIIKNIQTEYYKIKENQNSFKVDTLAVFSLSLDGTEVVTYRDKFSKIRLLTLWFDGEFGKNYEEYYFKNDSLIFSFMQFFENNVLVDTTVEKNEECDSESMDLNMKVSNEDEFYFNNNKLIRWLKNNEYNVNSKSREFKSLERSLLLNLKRILAELNEK